MITVNKGNVSLEGTMVTLCCELACAIRGVNDTIAEKLGAELAKKFVMASVDTAFEASRKKEPNTEKVNELLDSLFKEIFGGE